MKKIIPILAAMLLLAGCGNNSNQMPPAPEPSDNSTAPDVPGNGASAGADTNAAGTNTNAMGTGANVHAMPVTNSMH